MVLRECAAARADTCQRRWTRSRPVRPKFILRYAKGHSGVTTFRGQVGTECLWHPDASAVWHLHPVWRSAESMTPAPGHEPLHADWRDGRLSFTVRPLHIHSCVRLKAWRGP